MKKLNTRSATLMLALLAAAACEDTQGPTEPFADDLLTAGEQVELAILADNEAVAMAIELVAASTDVATRRGRPGADEGRDYASRARIRFNNAHDALSRGESREALSEARSARRLVTQGVRATGGDQAVTSMVERIEDLAITAARNPDAFDDAVAVSSELSVLAAEARSALNRGDITGAGDRAVLGEQRARNRRPGHNGRPGNVTADRAELAIEMGATAVALAERLLDGGADEEQLRFLNTAHEFLEKARAAFAGDEYQRAVHFAELASWNALKAVVLPGGITEDEQREMVDLAKSLYDEAVVAVGGAPTQQQAGMLERASRLLDLGETKLAEGHTRGVGALWQSAVISSWLIG